jgi:hypothetical protein
LADGYFLTNLKSFITHGSGFYFFDHHSFPPQQLGIIRRIALGWCHSSTDENFASSD